MKETFRKYEANLLRVRSNKYMSAAFNVEKLFKKKKKT